MEKSFETHYKLTKGYVFDSMFVLQRIVAKQHASVRLFESRKGFGARGDLVSALMAELPDGDQKFLMRSAPVRDMVLAPDGERYEALQKVLAGLSDSVEGDWRKRWGRLGFESDISLTGPYPFVVTLWDPVAPQGTWSEMRGVEKLFDEKISTKIGSAPCKLIAFDEARAREVAGALQDLTKLSMLVGQDISINVRHYCLFDFRDPEHNHESAGHIRAKSLTSSSMLGCCLLSPSLFTSRYITMEALYHEALHMKYFNFISVAKIHSDGYIGDSGEQFHCTWHATNLNGKPLWPFDRAFAAFHVYTHLFAFYNVVLSHPDAGPDYVEWVRERQVHIIERGTMLCDWLEGQYKKVFNENGKTFFHILATLFAESRRNYEEII
ncbi:MAG: hypothetical protein Q8916_00790 [Bacteroidota bacterium]|nr:hypothetical protein [Bacteroidota bacterium]MDP4236400.1 hypothetical protein [Bacteroidota bacterium]